MNLISVSEFTFSGTPRRLHGTILQSRSVRILFGRDMHQHQQQYTAFPRVLQNFPRRAATGRYQYRYGATARPLQCYNPPALVVLLCRDNFDNFCGPLCSLPNPCVLLYCWWVLLFAWVVASSPPLPSSRRRLLAWSGMT